MTLLLFPFREKQQLKEKMWMSICFAPTENPINSWGNDLLLPLNQLALHMWCMVRKTKKWKKKMSESNEIKKKKKNLYQNNIWEIVIFCWWQGTKTNAITQMLSCSNSNNFFLTPWLTCFLYDSQTEMEERAFKVHNFKH